MGTHVGPLPANDPSSYRQLNPTEYAQAALIPLSPEVEQLTEPAYEEKVEEVMRTDLGSEQELPHERATCSLSPAQMANWLSPTSLLALD